MDARGLVRSVRVVGASAGLGPLRAAWRRSRADAGSLPRRGAERARVPGLIQGVEPGPGGGVVRFARSALLVRVTVGGAVFCGWDGAGPEPSYALARGCPGADARTELEPDKDGGWRVVSERVTVAVSRHGAVEFRTPGGVPLRRDLPPRWWDPADAGPGCGAAGAGAGGSRWVQRSEVAADARFFGLGGWGSGARLRDGSYRLWNSARGPAPRPAGGSSSVTMPVRLVVADAGTHLVFHDNSWDGLVRLREGEEGAGSGHDRPGSCELRFDGGPLRSWTVVGTPARALRAWTALTGPPALPPRWALGHQHALHGEGGAEEAGRVAGEYQRHGLSLSALHLGAGHLRDGRVFTVDEVRFPDLPGLSSQLRESGVRLVSVVGPGVPADPGEAVYEAGAAAGVFVREARGREVRGAGRAGETVFPDFTDARARKWWSGLYQERLALGFAGFWHEGDEPDSFAAFGDPTLPRSALHALEGRGGDHREAHNVYALSMARAGREGLCELRPQERPFLFSGSGWAGSQRYGGLCASGVTADWPGLRASLSAVLGLGLCGVPYSGTDAGGRAGTPSPELYLRWLQLAAYLPLFRTHSAARAGRREPWEFGPRVLEHARSALRERERLLPYLATLAQLARRTGAPYARPLWWNTPRDRALRDCEDAFLLGDALLVAPVLEPGATRRAVRLPRGHWYDTATGETHEGAAQVLLDAPLDHVPVLARAGSVIPVAAPGGGVELEVWAPVPGRPGGGLYSAGAGGGWERPRLRRFISQLDGGRVVVTRDDGSQPGLPVRVRGSRAAAGS